MLMFGRKALVLGFVAIGMLAAAGVPLSHGGSAVDGRATGARASLAGGEIAYVDEPGLHGVNCLEVFDLAEMLPRRIGCAVAAGGGQVAWRSDGRALAFGRVGQSPGLWVADRDGTHLRRIAPLSRVRADLLVPEWSPDGTRLAFDPFTSDQECRSKPFDLRFSIADVNSGKSIAIHALPQPQTHVYLGPIEWSPNSRQLLYIVVRNSPDDTCTSRTTVLYTIDAAGRNRRFLTQGWISSPVWSPRGGTIAYVQCRSEFAQTCDVDLISGSRHVLVVARGKADNGTELKWSPNGDQLILTKASAVYLADIPDGHLHLLTKTQIKGDTISPTLQTVSSNRWLGVVTHLDYIRCCYHDPDQASLTLLPLDGGQAHTLPVPPPGTPLTFLSSLSLYLH
jgi:dipeptidyl aminopeptidase/acylaminoacyl peptidase